MPRYCFPVVAGILFLSTLHAPGDEPKARNVEQIAETCKKSVVVITASGRDGKRNGLGSGFVLSKDGLIATNLHVIGEARPISVQTADGKKHEVTEIHATDRTLDLAIIRIDGKDLTPLELGDTEQVKQGTAVVALGNPLGLEHSVTAGVISGERDIDGRKMLQVAIPVEPGNSGGPLVDMQGRVQGIVTLKSLVAANLGFAVPINSLKPLLKKPNPVAMERWLTIGALDPEEWKTVSGGRWRQRAGRLLVEGAGDGFGGRSLCLWQRELPELPFEMAVTVKLNDEAGAAGLAFCSDGGDKHYGFYPSGGAMRFVRFEGPDVQTWKILHNEPSPNYRPGEFNTLKVRFEKGKMLCFVNGKLAYESTDDVLSAGKVGLSKFRETQAEFKNFRVGKDLPARDVAADVAASILKKVGDVPPQEAVKPAVVDALVPDGDASLAVLRERAERLEQQAAQLRQLAVAVHQKRVLTDLEKVLQAKEKDIDLLHAALLIAKLDNDEVDVEVYRREIDRVGRRIAAGLAQDADEKAKIAALNAYMFTQRGYHGSRGDYYHKANSYLNEVIDDREGLPITLSVLYIELGRRIGLRLYGVGLPGHFIVKTADGQLIDVYEGGKLMSHADAEKRVKDSGRPFREEYLASMEKRAIIVRMLNNLLSLARGERDEPGMMRYLDAIVAVAPDSADERWMRAVLRYRAGQREASRSDVEWLLEKKPEGIDLERVRELREALER